MEIILDSVESRQSFSTINFVIIAFFIHGFYHYDALLRLCGFGSVALLCGFGSAASL
jgi:hypothetical protein